MHAVDAIAQMMDKATALERAKTLIQCLPFCAFAWYLHHLRHVVDIHVALMKPDQLQNRCEALRQSLIPQCERGENATRALIAGFTCKLSLESIQQLACRSLGQLQQHRA